jgi:hypothetical protein
MSKRAMTLAAAAWTVGVGIGWALLVPGFLSASSLAIFAAAGPVLVVAASTVRRAHAPVTSVRQSLVEAEAAATAARGRR